VTSASEEPPGAEGRRSPLLGGGPVTAVLFDYGLTLVHIERPVQAIDAAQDAVAALVEAAGHPRPDVAALREAVHDRVEAEVTAHEASGALEEIDVAALEQRAFAGIGLHLDAELLDRCRVLVQEAWWRGIRVYPDALEALRTLRDGGLRLGLCSNAPYRSASMHDQLAHVGLAALLDTAVFSGEVGWRKPSPRLFEAALRALDAGADETLFVGDRAREDIGGAADAGMRTVLIVRDGSAPQDLPSGHQPDATIRSLTELPALVLGDTQL
jgi:HAD superfamily hydrolase (TIGR01549 family)